VIEMPRIKLKDGLFCTIEKPTSLPTTRPDYRLKQIPESFIQRGRPKAGGELKSHWYRATIVRISSRIAL
jgi:hypothetical protein